MIFQEKKKINKIELKATKKEKNNSQPKKRP